MPLKLTEVNSFGGNYLGKHFNFNTIETYIWGATDIAQLVECLLNTCKALESILVPQKQATK
jgi:hypothetical protein